MSALQLYDLVAPVCSITCAQVDVSFPKATQASICPPRPPPPSQEAEFPHSPLFTLSHSSPPKRLYSNSKDKTKIRKYLHLPAARPRQPPDSACGDFEQARPAPLYGCRRRFPPIFENLPELDRERSSSLRAASGFAFAACGVSIADLLHACCFIQLFIQVCLLKGFILFLGGGIPIGNQAG